MLRVGINGLGRIGRAILRRNLEVNAFKVVAINDINPDIANIAYTINYDSTYGRLQEPYLVSPDQYLVRKADKIKVYHENDISKVNWDAMGIDLIIDSSGVNANVIASKKTLLDSNLKRVFITHSPDNQEVDYTLVLGANDEGFSKHHKVVASSICDATALAPVLKIIKNNLGIQMGSVTTLHPWLNYQNLLDGPASSWSVPGEIYHHYALGRSAFGNMIPKPTSALSATCKVLNGLSQDDLASFSYRTPTSIVGSADITLLVDKTVSRNSLLELFYQYENQQKWEIIHNNLSPLVSSDFARSTYSAIVDHRWTEVIKGNMIKLVLWYDNEWGYASRVVDQVKFSLNY